MAKSYSIYDTKAHLSRLLRRVKEHGEELIITERGKPIARLIPYEDAMKAQTFEERLQWLESTGQLLRAKRKTFPKIEGVRRPGGLKRFLDERD